MRRCEPIYAVLHPGTYLSPESLSVVLELRQEHPLGNPSCRVDRATGVLQREWPRRDTTTQAGTELTLRFSLSGVAAHAVGRQTTIASSHGWSSRRTSIQQSGRRAS